MSEPVQDSGAEVGRCAGARLREHDVHRELEVDEDDVSSLLLRGHGSAVHHCGFGEGGRRVLCDGCVWGCSSEQASDVAGVALLRRRFDVRAEAVNFLGDDEVRFAIEVDCLLNHS